MIGIKPCCYVTVSRFVVLACLLSGMWVGAQQENVVQMDTLNVRDVLYHLAGGGGNAMALIDEVSTDRGVVLIDTKPLGWGPATLEVIEQVTDLPVKMIINTHAHPEHAGSNAEFKSVEEIIAHQNTRARMITSGLYADGAAGLPTTTFMDRYSLLDGLDQIELYHFGPAHTDGDIVVVFPQKGVAYLGDLFAGKGIPVIDIESGGSGLAFPETLAKVVAEIKDVSRVITGHDEFPTTYAGRGRRELGANRAWTGFFTWDDLAEYADFTREFVDAVEIAFGEGQSAAEAATTLRLPVQYADYDMEHAVASIESIYTELSVR